MFKNSLDEIFCQGIRKINFWGKITYSEEHAVTDLPQYCSLLHFVYKTHPISAIYIIVHKMQSVVYAMFHKTHVITAF